MKVIDLNLLIYSVNRDAQQHERARTWLETILSGSEPVGLAWVVLLGFIRITTQRRVLPHALASDRALAIVNEWLEQPSVRLLQPGSEHWRILRLLLDEAGTAGNLTTDAHLAALTIENGGELLTTDRDFGRFRGLRWTNPLADP